MDNMPGFKIYKDNKRYLLIMFRNKYRSEKRHGFFKEKKNTHTYRYKSITVGHILRIYLSPIRPEYDMIRIFFGTSKGIEDGVRATVTEIIFRF